MSSSQAIAAVTSTLRNLISQRVSEEIGGGNVTARPPDKARENGDRNNQINIFLYQTLPNASWRNRDLPTQVKPGEKAQPPLALNLYYLITAYGQDDDDISGHRLLGTAMQVLHDYTLLNPRNIDNALDNSTLQHQFERIRITPITLSSEELSRLWSSFQTPYRISTTYEVSVILIESHRPVKAALPVLKRGSEDKGIRAQPNPIPPCPTLESLIPPNDQASVRLGEILTLRGHHLDSEDSQIDVLFSHPRLRQVITVEADSISATQVRVTLSPNAGEWLVGFYTIAVQLRQEGKQQNSNTLSFSLAPRIEFDSPVNANDTFKITCDPPVRPGQQVALFLGSRQFLPQIEADENPPMEPLNELEFNLTGIPLGAYWLRLRVDGIDSLLVDRTTDPPTFDQTQRLSINE